MNKKSIARNKSFQPSGAGKGDGDRTSDVDAYRNNYDEIDWGRKHEDELKGAYAKLQPSHGILRTVTFARRFTNYTRGS